MVVKMVVRPIAKLCEELDHVQAVNRHSASKGVDHCSSTHRLPVAAVGAADDDQLHERELVTLNAVLLAFPKLTCINIHCVGLALRQEGEVSARLAQR